MSLEDLKTQTEYETFWLEEVGRRIEKLERGESRLVPLEKALKLARAARAKPIEADE